MISINGLAQMAIDISGKTRPLLGPKKLNICNIEGPLGVRGRNSDNKLIQEKLGWAPTQPLRIGMEKTYEWINEQVKINSGR